MQINSVAVFRQQTAGIIRIPGGKERQEVNLLTNLGSSL
jgi:hypothetical protein